MLSPRLERINKHLAKELEVQQLRNKIQTEVQDSVQQSQRDYYLREQMKAIQKELGDLDDTQKDIAELKEKIEAAGHARRDEERRAEGTEPAEPDESRWRPTTRSRATTSSGWPCCRGRSPRPARWTS